MDEKERIGAPEIPSALEQAPDLLPEPEMSEQETPEPSEPGEPTVAEHPAETQSAVPVAAVPGGRTRLPAGKVHGSVPTVEIVSRDPAAAEIETILSDGLEEQFLKMDPALQKKFKLVGEQTASSIAQLLGAAQANARKILELITSWLKMIPGVNKFFLEQEAKIKTDRIISSRP